MFNNAGGIENRILGEGTHFRIPFFESVISMPIQTQTSDFNEEGADSAGTQDSQQVDIKLTVNWHLDPSRVNRTYQQYGTVDAIQTNFLTNNVKDAIKQAISKYQALEVQKNRDNVGAKAESILQERMRKYNVFVDNLSITNINFSQQFNQAIEDAQTAQQKAKQAEYNVQTAKNNADAAIAQATGEAEAQRLKQQSLTPAILQQQWIARWDGKLPTYQSSVTPLISLPNLGQ